MAITRHACIILCWGDESVAITRHACIILCWGDESVAITRHACIILCWGDGECGYYTSCVHNTVLGRRRVWLLHVMHA